jgi:hypothetical protein
MIKKIFAVYDNVAKVFDAPVVVRHEAEAVRGFTDGVKSPDTMLNKSPDDYALHLIGTFDDVTGEVTVDGACEVLSARSIIGDVSE